MVVAVGGGVAVAVAVIVTSAGPGELGLGLAKCHALEQPQQVSGGEHCAESSDHHEHPEHVVVQTGRW